MRRRERVTYPLSLEIVALRKAGMSIPDIVVALEHFRGARLTYHQVSCVLRKIGQRQGERPARALARIGPRDHPVLGGVVVPFERLEDAA